MNSTQLGILATNLYVAQALGVSIYCPPDGLALNGNQLVSMLQAAVKERPQIGNLPVGPALLFVLIQTFPCPRISK